MSSGAKQILYITKESTIGVTPVLPVWTTLPFKTSSLDANVKKTESDTIRDSRISRGGAVTSQEVSGEIEVNLSYGTYDDMLAAAFYNNWDLDILSIGSVRQTFSAVRGFKDAGGYHHFRGLHVSQFALDIPEEGNITAKFSFAGLSRSQQATAPTGTINPASTAEELTNVGVGEITLDGVSLKGLACVTAFSFNLNNNLKAQKCLGDGLNIGKQIETQTTITGSVTVAWGDKAAEIYEKQFTNGKLEFEVPFSDGDGNDYVLTLPVVTITGSLPNGSATDLLQTTFEYSVQDASPTITRIPK